MKRLVLTWPIVQGLVGDIVHQLVSDEWKPDRIVGISRGGLAPAVMLSQYFGAPMTPLVVSLRDSNESVSDTTLSGVALGYDPATATADKRLRRNILIVDDINDTGATQAWIKADWQNSCFPQSKDWSKVWHHNVRFAYLVNNAASTGNADYLGMEIDKRENDQWIVYPWEHWWA